MKESERRDLPSAETPEVSRSHPRPADPPGRTGPVDDTRPADPPRATGPVDDARPADSAAYDQHPDPAPPQPPAPDAGGLDVQAARSRPRFPDATAPETADPDESWTIEADYDPPDPGETWTAYADDPPPEQPDAIALTGEVLPADPARGEAWPVAAPYVDEPWPTDTGNPHPHTGESSAAEPWPTSADFWATHSRLSEAGRADPGTHRPAHASDPDDKAAAVWQEAPDPYADARPSPPPETVRLPVLGTDGWPVAGGRPPADDAPDDWPPVPPEDEPTAPIDGLAEAVGERTDELPIVGPRPQPAPAAAAPGRRWLVGAGIVAVLLLLAGGTAVAVGYDTRDRAGIHQSADAAPGTTPADAVRTADAPLDGRTEAGFDLVDGAATITLRTADLGGDLYRVRTPEATPRVTDEAGRVRLFLDHGTPENVVEIALSDKVRWDLRVGGGAELSTIDLREARLAALDLAGGASRINLTLPKPDGTLTVRMSGGVNRFDVHTADGVPVRVRLGSGAGQVVLDGTSHNGVAAGASFTPATWNQAQDRIDVDAVAGMSALTVGP